MFFLDLTLTKDRKIQVELKFQEQALEKDLRKQERRRVITNINNEIKCVYIFT